MNRDVMTTKKWLLYFLKFIIPIYNIYWLIICIIGKEDKVNVNERNYTLAALIYGVIMSVVITVIYALIFGVIIASLGISNNKLNTKNNSYYESYTNDDSDDDYNTDDIYNDDYNDSNIDDTENTSNDSLLTIDNNTYSMYGISFTSSLPLESQEDTSYVELNCNDSEHGYLDVSVFKFTGMSVDELKSDNSELRTDGSYISNRDGCTVVYIPVNNDCIEMSIYYDDQNESSMNEILDSITVEP